jgi:hypothetical protein
MDVAVSINSVEYVGALGAVDELSIKEFVEGLGYVWVDVEVFVANVPTQGNYLYKAIGCTHLTAGK